MKWGAQPDTGRRVSLYIAGGLVALALALLSQSVDAAHARVRANRSYCLGTGPVADIPMVSDDGGTTWNKP